MNSFVFRFISIVYLLGGFVLALPSSPDAANAIRSSAINSARSADTCADPSLAQTVYQAFMPSETAHVLNYRHAFETGNSNGAAIVWADLHPAFNAWLTQQNFTVPLFQLGATGGTKFIYRIGVDANTPPAVSGFNTEVFVVAWVYSTQVCGSVPLMSAVLASATDSYYTINSFEHDNLISPSFRWTDDGVVGYVLPLNSS